MVSSSFHASVLSKAEEKTLQTSLHEAMSETTKNPVIAPNIGQTSASRAEKGEAALFVEESTGSDTDTCTLCRATFVCKES